jgi:hypothetical protein
MEYTLGIYISTNVDDMIRINFDERLDKVKHIFDIWRRHRLTIKGKVLIINTYAIPQMLYAGTVFHLPPWVEKAYNELIRDFIWEGKPSKIKYSCLINEISKGGLKLQDFKSKLMAIKVKWIKMLCDQEYQAAWKEYITLKFPKNMNSIPMYNLKVDDYPNWEEPFYKELLTMWASLHYTEPEDPIEIRQQTIWLNSNIKIDNKVIYYKEWQQKGIIKIKDIVNDKGQLMTKENI